MKIRASWELLEHAQDLDLDFAYNGFLLPLSFPSSNFAANGKATEIIWAYNVNESYWKGDEGNAKFETSSR